MREISRLRREQESVGVDHENPALMTELRALRKRKDELENHLTSLQDSRRHLMLQLEGLMKLLKNHQASPKSTPNSSPRSSKSPPPSSSRSAPPTPTPTPSADCVGLGLGSGFGGSASLQASQTSLSRNSVGGQSNRSICTELLQAADSVTNAMSTLVSQLNSESDSEATPTEERIRKPIGFTDREDEMWRDNSCYNQKEEDLQKEDTLWQNG